MKALKILKIKQLICKQKINFVKQLVYHSLCKQILNKSIDNRNLYEKKSNSFVEDLIKVISNILKCKIQEVGKNKLKIMQIKKIGGNLFKIKRRFRHNEILLRRHK